MLPPDYYIRIDRDAFTRGGTIAHFRNTPAVEVYANEEKKILATQCTKLMSLRDRGYAVKERLERIFDVLVRNAPHLCSDRRLTQTISSTLLTDRYPDRYS